MWRLRIAHEGQGEYRLVGGWEVNDQWASAPVKVERKEAGRVRLLLLCPYGNFLRHQPCEPLQIVNDYLASLPEDEKVRRARERQEV